MDRERRPTAGSDSAHQPSPPIELVEERRSELDELLRSRVLQDGEYGFPVIQAERDELVSPRGRVEKGPRAAVEACPRKQRRELECLLAGNAHTSENRHTENRTPGWCSHSAWPHNRVPVARAEFAKAIYEESSEPRPGLWRRASSLTGLGSPRAPRGVALRGDGSLGRGAARSVTTVTSVPSSSTLTMTNSRSRRPTVSPTRAGSPCQVSAETSPSVKPSSVRGHSATLGPREFAGRRVSRTRPRQCHSGESSRHSLFGAGSRAHPCRCGSGREPCRASRAMFCGAPGPVRSSTPP